MLLKEKDLGHGNNAKRSDKIMCWQAASHEGHRL